jgi:WD40 repeat protein
VRDLINSTSAIVECTHRDHTDSIFLSCIAIRDEGLGFFTRHNESYLVSVSKDTLMKVWDLSSQYCVQTIVGHRCEIWSLLVLNSSIDTNNKSSSGLEPESNEDAPYDTDIKIITGTT